MLKLLIDRLEAISFKMTENGDEYDGATVAHAAALIKLLAVGPGRKIAPAAICELEKLLRDLESGARWKV